MAQSVVKAGWLHRETGNNLNDFVFSATRTGVRAIATGPNNQVYPGTFRPGFHGHFFFDKIGLS